MHGRRQGIQAAAGARAAGRRPWGVLIAYAAAMAFMVATYPRGADLQRLYLAVELAAMCASLGCLLVWFRSREPLSLKAVATGIIVSVELAMVTGGPYRGNILHQLPEHEGAVIAAHDMFEMSMEEAAEQQDAPVSTAYRWRARGIAALTRALRPRRG
ncbi:RNA polymerase sigma factor [Sorangium sp. So ce128]|uniref:RNA polymerase sigma factor n=1 Tax=Sorangium sp. So ce128 TaxID=3133281 RepID=UPI003F615650